MWKFGLSLLLLALLVASAGFAGMFGFAGVAGGTLTVAKVFFVGFLVMSAVALVANALRSSER